MIVVRGAINCADNICGVVVTQWYPYFSVFYLFTSLVSIFCGVVPLILNFLHLACIQFVIMVRASTATAKNRSHKQLQALPMQRQCHIFPRYATWSNDTFQGHAYYGNLWKEEEKYKQSIQIAHFVQLSKPFDFRPSLDLKCNCSKKSVKRF